MFLAPNYLEIMLSGGVACVNAMVMYGEGYFRCSLNFSPKVLEVSPMYSSSHVSPTSVCHGVLVLWGDQEVFNGAIAFEMGLYTIPTADLLMLLHRPWV